MSKETVIKRRAYFFTPFTRVMGVISLFNSHFIFKRSFIMNHNERYALYYALSAPVLFGLYVSGEYITLLERFARGIFVRLFKKFISDTAGEYC
jgi:hypothetical protein